MPLNAVFLVVFSMHIFLPDEEFGLENLLQKAAASGGDFLRQDFEQYSDKAYIWIPKFKFSYLTSKGLKTMQEMGLKSPFDRNICELKEMGNGGLSVSEIVQKSFIEVDEKGTKAVAVTICKAPRVCSASGSPKKFIANRPFMLMIREETSKIILFTGVVLDPKAH